MKHTETTRITDDQPEVDDDQAKEANQQEELSHNEEQTNKESDQTTPLENETDLDAEPLKTLTAEMEETDENGDTSEVSEATEDSADKAEVESAATMNEDVPPTHQHDLQQATEQLLAIAEQLKHEDGLGSDSDDKALDDVSTTIKEIAATQQGLRKDFNEKLKYDEHKEHLIDKLHKELQDHKDGVVKSAMQPLVRDLIMINDNIFKLVDNFRSSGEPLDAEAILNHMESITIDIDDALYRQGIEPFNSPAEKVDPLKQSIFKTVKVNDQTKEKQLAERLRKGYEWDEQIIRKELVSVYVYDKHADETNEDEKEGVDKK